jgi:hypothetical protein
MFYTYSFVDFITQVTLVVDCSIDGSTGTFILKRGTFIAGDSTNIWHKVRIFPTLEI